MRTEKERNGNVSGQGEHWIVEHRENAEGVREQPLIWHSRPIRADSAWEALETFLALPEGFKPMPMTEVLVVRRAA